MTLPEENVVHLLVTPEEALAYGLEAGSDWMTAPMEVRKAALLDWSAACYAKEEGLDVEELDDPREQGRLWLCAELEGVEDE